MLEIYTTSFILRHILQKSEQFLLQKSEVRLSCKTTFQNERTNQLIVQNCTPHIDTKTYLKVAFHSGMGILICPDMRVVCIIDTVATELRFVSKLDVTMQLANPIEPLANSSLSTKSPGPRCCTHCTWYGYMPSACSVLHTLVWVIRKRLAILRVLARGLLCTI